MAALFRLTNVLYLSTAFRRYFHKPTAPHIVNVERPKRPDYFDDGLVYYTMAVPEDKELVMNFMLENFLKDGPFQKAVQATRDEVVDFYADIMEPCLKSGSSVLAFEGDELLSIQLSRVQKISSNNKQLLDVSDPSFAGVEPDFAEVIRNGPYKLEKVNQMHTYVNALQRDFQRIFPPSSCVLVVEIAVVVEKMRRRGLTFDMGYLGFRHSQDMGCDHVMLTVIAPGLQQMVKKEAFHKVARTLMFKDFKANGKPVFGDVLDGGGKLVYGAYKDLAFMPQPSS